MTEVALDAARLLLNGRWAALASLDDSGPLASMVAYAPDPSCGGVLMLLSELAQHTRNLLEDPRASLVVSAPDVGGGDPQQLARVTLIGEARPLTPGSRTCEDAKAIYLAHLPDAGPRFALADFRLFRLLPATVRYVGGLARAASLSSAELAGAAAALGGTGR